jgi:Tfp pilus assembly protein PilN
MRFAGIEVSEREVRVARAERRLGRVTVRGLARVAAADSGAVAAAFASVAAWRPQLVRTVVPAAAVTHRFLRLPFRDQRRLARTVPLELAGHLPFDAGDAPIAFARIDVAGDGATVLAALAPRPALDAAMAPLRAAGLRAARVELAPLPAWRLVPPGVGDAALVIADGGRSALSIRRDGRVAALRALGAVGEEPDALVAEVRWALAALGGAPPTLVVAGADAGTALLRALARAIPAAVEPLARVTDVPLPPDVDVAAVAVAAGLVLDDRPGVPLALAGEVARPLAGRRVAALAGAALCLAALDTGLVRWGLARQDAALTRAIQNEATSALPGVPLVAPQAQLADAVARATRTAARLGGPAGALGLMRELATRLPSTMRLDLDELDVDGEALRLHGRCESFDAVEALRRALAGSPYLADVTAEETRSTVDGRHVEFRLRATRRPTGAGTQS